MKKFTLCLSIAFLFSAYFSIESNAATSINSHSKAAIKSYESDEANVMLARIEFIKAMDKSALNFTEKRQLRREVRTINNQLRDLDGGTFLSVGSIILMSLLIILLL